MSWTCWVMIGQRNMLCGMHVHVEFFRSGAPRRRHDADAAVSAVVHRAVDVVAVLAGPRHRPAGKATRLAAYDDKLPRTGLPELFRGNGDYDEYVPRR